MTTNCGNDIAKIGKKICGNTIVEIGRKIKVTNYLRQLHCRNKKKKNWKYYCRNKGIKFFLAIVTMELPKM